MIKLIVIASTSKSKINFQLLVNNICKFSRSNIKPFEIKRAYLAFKATFVFLETHLVVVCCSKAISTGGFELSFQTVVWKQIILLVSSGAQQLL